MTTFANLTIGRRNPRPPTAAETKILRIAWGAYHARTYLGRAEIARRAGLEAPLVDRLVSLLYRQGHWPPWKNSDHTRGKQNERKLNPDRKPRERTYTRIWRGERATPTLRLLSLDSVIAEYRGQIVFD